MAVLLDVVYNHFGPEGNYTGCFAPYTKTADTPWGAAINFDEAYNYGVREFFLENLVRNILVTVDRKVIEAADIDAASYNFV